MNSTPDGCMCGSSHEPGPAPVASTNNYDFESAFDSHWCPDCWAQLDNDNRNCCSKCGARLPHESPYQTGCGLCADLDLRFVRTIAVGNYCGLLQELVIRMKNQHDEQLAIHLGKRLAYELARADFFNEIEMIAPVPTHWWRRVRRGFQSANVISESVAAACGIPQSGQLTRCIRGTKKQGTLSTAGRFDNVRGAFAVRPGVDLSGLRILVIDDVMTSGATASEMSRILLSKGAAKVYVGVIARGARVS